MEVDSITPWSLYAKKGNQQPMYRRLGGPHSRSRQVQKTSPLLGFDLRTVQLVINPTTLLQAIKYLTLVHNSGPKIERKETTWMTNLEERKILICTLQVLQLNGRMCEIFWKFLDQSLEKRVYHGVRLF
jgi:hypothetical protein